MKLQHFNKKVLKAVSKTNNKTVTKRSKSGFNSTIPINFTNETNKKSFGSILNTLPDPIKMIINVGNPIKEIKQNESITFIRTITGLEITIKTNTLNDKVPQCKIKNKNTREVILDTMKR